MVTKKQAIDETEFHTPDWHNADGTPQRWRANGQCKIWKTRPNEFSLPIKRGMYEYAYLTHDNAHLFNVGHIYN